jgi:phage shock protein C
MTTPPPTPPTAPRKLYRSRTDRMLGGVCGGLAAYLNMDVTVVRLIAVATILLPGPSIIAYLLAWIIVPEEPWIAASERDNPAR